MKVLKEPPKFVPFQVACRLCGAVLEIDSLSDLVRHEGYDPRDQEGWDYLTVECPCCGTGSQIQSQKVPAHLLEKIKRA